MTFLLADADVLPAEPLPMLPEIGRGVDVVIGQPAVLSPSASDEEDDFEPEEAPAPIGDFDDFDEEDFDDEFDDDFEGELEDEYQLSEFEEVTEEDLIETDCELPLGDLVDEDAEDEPIEPVEEEEKKEEEEAPKGKKGKGKEAKGKKKAKEEEEDEDDDFDDDE